MGELAKAAGLSERTIDYYTKLGLIDPETRSEKNYRLYGHETVGLLERINEWKQDKYSLEEIRSLIGKWKAATAEAAVSGKLAELEVHMQKLQRELKELEPALSQLKPNQARRALAHLIPQGLACIEAIRIMMTQGPSM
ncbi:MerR family transcriptional regulator [Paenibacillus sp. HN-1]|uniref:helix-turn-helix domain-containing protein n=1 Tax=Paenibacillus TaxID=44249 RepID=UPI001CA80634|nr:MULTISPECIES: MerR family transcriptional regulator [Paenibacillus]MBY9082475.1 MerR family transcriptional regulator [Paenibacillus sp. CGMCC 1.18879]MBY9084834.1 MerR family transcriptional regulator [Paenibacillus sinensis]